MREETSFNRPRLTPFVVVNYFSSHEGVFIIPGEIHLFLCFLCVYRRIAIILKVVVVLLLFDKKYSNIIIVVALYN